MKIKLNWGTGVVIAMVLFMLFILQFVYRVTFMDEYDHSLVTEDYYEEEIHYQEEINKENNNNLLEKNVTLEHVGNGIKIYFPESIPQNEIKGTVYFKRLSNEKLDFQKDISESIENHVVFIPKENLVEGKYQIKIDWKVKDQDYLLKESIFF